MPQSSRRAATAAAVDPSAIGPLGVRAARDHIPVGYRLTGTTVAIAPACGSGTTAGRRGGGGSVHDRVACRAVT